MRKWSYVLLIINGINIVEKIRWGYFVKNTSRLIIYMPSMLDLMISIIVSLIATVVIVKKMTNDDHSNVVFRDDVLDAFDKALPKRNYWFVGILTLAACFYVSIKAMF
ncbi:hypothetical protein [Lewinella cohaerens]|uniref:hypothetical protein n=1 Tax=Lewinella cohaerens TaxID=70995 RepID=UPI0012EC06D3|nr:hypothetical protein [Lewinella cohaerens]